MIRCISDFAIPGLDSGVGLALQDEQARYIFMVAGTRHSCPPGTLFYGGVGGRREHDEDWLECARREAEEEVSARIDVIPASTSYYVSRSFIVSRLDLEDRPAPFMLYEMLHLPGYKRAGELYNLVIYHARLCDPPGVLQPEELGGLIALTAEQVRRSVERQPTLGNLLDEGAALVAGDLDHQIRLYPIGVALALAHLLRHTALSNEASY